MAGECLENMGNVRCMPEPMQVAEGTGSIFGEGLVLKFYEMSKKSGTGFDQRTSNYMRGLLRKMVNSRQIQPLSGFGFGILSEGYLNVGVWDNKDPVILKSKLFGFDYDHLQDNVSTPEKILKRKTIGTVGPFCAFELAIVSHEGQSWRNYLQSQKTGKDKEIYVLDKFSGRID